MYIIHTQWGFVVKIEGGWSYTKDESRATRWPSREEAAANKPGHHRDMGGTGFKGTVIKVSR